jgi:hypothetical protein
MEIMERRRGIKKNISLISIIPTSPFLTSNKNLTELMLSGKIKNW